MSWRIGGRPSSLAVRLTIWYSMAVVVLLATAVAAVHISLDRESEREEAAAVGPALAKVHANREWFLRTQSPEDVESPLRVIDPGGVTIHEARILAHEFSESTFPANGERAYGFTADGRRYALYTREFDGWRYQVALGRAGESALIYRLYRNVAIAMVPILALAVLSGLLIARAGLRPLRRVAAEVRALSTDRLDQRINTREVPLELANVAHSFNDTLDRLAGAITRLDQFAADVAHELRTPVHNLRAAAELALRTTAGEDPRQPLSAVFDEADRVARLIDRLLLLARLADPRAALVLEPIDVAAELDALAEFFEPAATDVGVVIAVDAPGGPPQRLDRALVQRAVSNLVANALAHTPPGGRIELKARLVPTGLEIEVVDTGEGIPAEAIPHLFDRYYRPVSSAEGGLGLGLTIVKRVVELHGGTATIESRRGTGTTARLFFPVPTT